MTAVTVEFIKALRRPRQGVASPTSNFMLKVSPKTNGSKHLLLATEEILPGGLPEPGTRAFLSRKYSFSAATSGPTFESWHLTFALGPGPLEVALHEPCGTSQHELSIRQPCSRKHSSHWD